jgi:hypothetical protein
LCKNCFTDHLFASTAKAGSIDLSHEPFIAGKPLQLFDAQAPVDKWIPAFAGNAASDLRPARPLLIFP